MRDLRQAPPTGATSALYQAGASRPTLVDRPRRRIHELPGRVVQGHVIGAYPAQLVKEAQHAADTGFLIRAGDGGQQLDGDPDSSPRFPP